MLAAGKMEEDLGIEVYSTTSDGIGGIIRQTREDFLVKEVPLTADRLQDHEGDEKGNKFSVFWLEKRGLDTILAIKRIAKSLGVSQERFSFAGMKDRNAVTLQRVSVWNVLPEKLKQVDVKGVLIKEISKSDNPVRIGSHWGNQFSIVVRKIPLTVGEVENRVQKISEEINSSQGASNYFGHQRFGLSRPVTHIVGLKLLKGELVDAAMVFLSKTSQYETDDVRAARTELESTGDFVLAARRFPAKLSYELTMLNRLASKPNDFANAFRALPRRLLQMFVSAAQAWLFNRFLSARLKRQIPLNRCVNGDIVVSLNRHGLTADELTKVSQSNLEASNESLLSGKAVVLYPVPGFDMNLPQGVMYDVVRETMKQENLFPRSFWISMMPEISSKGTFRSIVLLPRDLKVTTSCSDSRSTSNARFEFSLVRGGYATVVLREFMKNGDPLAAGY